MERIRGRNSHLFTEHKKIAMKEPEKIPPEMEREYAEGWHQLGWLIIFVLVLVGIFILFKHLIINLFT
jgi:hypothetical protein